MDQKDAQKRATALWGSGVHVNKVWEHPIERRVSSDGAVEWWVEIPGDPRMHLLDGDGQTCCKHDGACTKK